MSNQQWGHGFYSAVDEAGGPFKAIRFGAADAICELIRGATQMPGLDIFEEIQKGIEIAIDAWINSHEEDILNAISKGVSDKLYEVHNK